MQNSETFDLRVRRHIYYITLRRGYPPTLAEASEDLRVSVEEVRVAFQRLATGRVVVVQRDTDEILMANPFSAVPTPFVVETDDYSCFGNCIWDSLGIAAMLNKDARIKTACGECGTAMEVRVVNGAVQGDGLIHFAIPALHWWDDIVFN
ncbi:MAG: hypothetical protein HY023_14055 [Chloroflexi bacterium]|nr:hypothetical protein [Chloroflexota bacterium]